MASAETTVAVAEPVFADQQTIYELLGVPENTLRQLACELVVACHKLAEGKQGKCVYLFSDVKEWVASRPSPEWVQRYQRNMGKVAAK